MVSRVRLSSWDETAGAGETRRMKQADPPRKKMLTAAGKPYLERRCWKELSCPKKQAEVTFGADVSME